MITINELKYEKTFNLGSYQSEKVGLSVALEGAVDAKKILKQMMAFAESRGESGLGEGTVIQETNVQESSKKTPAAKKAASPAEPATKKEAAPEPVEEAVEEKIEEKKEPVKKALKSKNTPYNRAEGLHKTLLTKMLDANVTNWRARAAKAKEASEKMDGEDFLNQEGLILEEFKTAFILKMA